MTVSERPVSERPVSERPVKRRQDYDGTSPFPGAGEHCRAGRAQTALTASIVIAPFAALGAVIYLAWGQGVALTDLLLAAGFYVVTGLGVTVGFHRLLTHGSFTARPWLRVTLAVAGSMGFQGNVSAGSPSTAAITPSPTDRATRTPLTATAPACVGSFAGLPTPIGLAVRRRPDSAAALRPGPARPILP